jgi:hypothetical protein
MLRWLGLLLLLLAIAACSGTRVVYNQLDWLVVWQVKKYFDLDEAQEQDLRERVGRQLAWHRETQLPRYAALSEDLGHALAVEPGPEYFAGILAGTQVFWADFMGHAVPDAAAFLAGLSDAQVEQLFEKIEENNRELAEEYAGDTAAIRRDRRERAIIRSVSRLTGRLNGPQQALVRDYSGRMHDLSLAWLDRRRDWQQEFRAALEIRDNTIELERRLAPLLLDPDRNDPPAYRLLVEENQQVVFEMLSALSAELTPRQRDRFQKRLLGYARDFRLLAGMTG